MAQVERSGPATIIGFVYRRDDHAARPIVELIIDGLPIALGRANIYRAELERDGIGDGRYGFSFVLAPDVMAGGGAAQIVLANLGRPLGPPISLGLWALAEGPPAGEAGAAVWTGGLRLSGWLAPSRDPVRLRARAWIDGTLIAEARPDRWRQRSHGGETPAPAFSLHLPERFATGLTQQVTVTDGIGTPLRGSPLTLVAFSDPLETLAAGAFGPDAGVTARRARLFDTLLPRTHPLDDLRGWTQAYPAPGAPARRLTVVIVGDAPVDTAATRDSLRGQLDPSCAVVVLPSGDRIGFAPDDLLAVIGGAAANCDSLLLIPAGTRLEPGAAGRLAAVLASDRHARLVYGDLAAGPPDRPSLLAFPSFDYERWLEQGYGALLFALPLAVAADATRAGADSLYRLANAQCDDLARAREAIVHLPGLAGTLPDLDLAAATRWLERASTLHLQARGMPAEVRPGRGAILPAVRVTRLQQPDATVSVIIPTRDHPESLRRCIASIRPALDRARADLVIVDNGSSQTETPALLAAIRAAGDRLLTEPGPFNHARLINRAVAAAWGEFVCLLHDDVEAQDDTWLAELLGRLREPTTAAAGAVLLGPSGVVAHGGTVLGPRAETGPALTDWLGDEAGYADLLRVASEPSALSTACLLVRRSAYDAVGGLDERYFPNDLGAVDLCLKLAARGDRVVLTPHANLLHRSARDAEQTSRNGDAGRRAREAAALRARWSAVLSADPAYNPLLALSDPTYAALACPPRGSEPRRRTIDPPAAMPLGL
ncbi:glycosyltransferase [Methylobacterium sp. E-065]|uniref:glycosyltransferase family 2 protein n=1 Tax=Methylobacterium sp. E-065 TaxID=2836583 RepID=UPI001FB9392B|nr:glycosyltransferase [Methylobacterium sp. E-065]MCJ2017998.1 glycosyltransferase [Methylobacterium sp. E-065]